MSALWKYRKFLKQRAGMEAGPYACMKEFVGADFHVRLLEISQVFETAGRQGSRLLRI